MNYHGIEIFFQNLGNADSIFVRHWDNGVLTNILIDGGRKQHAPEVAKFLIERGKESGDATIHHLICSHSHDDHAAGLVDLVELEIFDIKNAWIHDTRTEHRILTPQAQLLFEAAGVRRVANAIQESEATRHNLIEALEAQDVPINAPFTGAQIGPLVVLSPSPQFFDQQFGKLKNLTFLSEMEERLSSKERQHLLRSIRTASPFDEVVAEMLDETSDLGGEPTSPENEVSTILALPWTNGVNEDIYLFTADAGCEAFNDVLDVFAQSLRRLPWMQVPHHGSRRNLSQEMVDHLAPKIAFISCDGTRKHPSQKLVNALKEHGDVFSTAYSVGEKSWLRHQVGTVPVLSTVPAIRLYDRPN